MRMGIDHIPFDLFMGEVKRLSQVFPIDLENLEVGAERCDDCKAPMDAIRAGVGYRLLFQPRDDVTAADLLDGLSFHEQEEEFREMADWLAQDYRDHHEGQEPESLHSPEDVRRMVAPTIPPEVEALDKPARQEWMRKAERMGYFDSCFTLSMTAIHYEAGDEVGQIVLGCDDAIWMGADLIRGLAALPIDGEGDTWNNNLYSAETRRHQVELNYKYPFEDAVEMCRWRIAL
jgi:hypothetical protein